mmetsp:Transcript_16874/g.49354  ORF Transcript_16874/g.49354 Transcript_16874/m.49354 type:complete len:207 (-) Transcript_16874:276-896(-)
MLRPAIWKRHPAIWMGWWHHVHCQPPAPQRPRQLPWHNPAAAKGPRWLCLPSATWNCDATLGLLPSATWSSDVRKPRQLLPPQRRGSWLLQRMAVWMAAWMASEPTSRPAAKVAASCTAKGSGPDNDFGHCRKTALHPDPAAPCRWASRPGLAAAHHWPLRESPFATKPAQAIARPSPDRAAARGSAVRRPGSEASPPLRHSRGRG